MCLCAVLCVYTCVHIHTYACFPKKCVLKHISFFGGVSTFTNENYLEDERLRFIVKYKDTTGGKTFAAFGELSRIFEPVTKQPQWTRCTAIALRTYQSAIVQTLSATYSQTAIRKKKSSTRLNSPGLHVFFFPTEKNRNKRNLLESPNVILSEVESTTVLSRHFCPKHLVVLIGRASLRVPDTLPLRLH